MSEQSVRQGPRSCNLFCQKRKKYHLPNTFSQKHTRIVTLKKETIFTGVGDIHVLFWEIGNYGIKMSHSRTRRVLRHWNHHVLHEIARLFLHKWPRFSAGDYICFSKECGWCARRPQHPCVVVTLWTLSWGRRILGGCLGVPRGCCKSRLKSPWVSKATAFCCLVENPSCGRRGPRSPPPALSCGPAAHWPRSRCGARHCHCSLSVAAGPAGGSVVGGLPRCTRVVGSIPDQGTYRNQPVNIPVSGTTDRCFSLPPHFLPFSAPS